MITPRARKVAAVGAPGEPGDAQDDGERGRQFGVDLLAGGEGRPAVRGKLVGDVEVTVLGQGDRGEQVLRLVDGGVLVVGGRYADPGRGGTRSLRRPTAPIAAVAAGSLAAR